MNSPRHSPGPFHVLPSVQKYAWGDTEFIPRLLGQQPSGEPYAELWYGAHPGAPAIARQGRAPQVVDQRLDAVIRETSTKILGTTVEEQFGELPYLLKVLAARRPLSIQVHPSEARARAGFEQENAAEVPLSAHNRRYRDPHHKPELLVALEPFAALCGFRPHAQFPEILSRIEEVSALLPHFDVASPNLPDLLQAYFRLSSDVLATAWSKLLLRLERQESSSPHPTDSPEYWALRAHRQLNEGGDPDPGLLFVFLLQLIHLRPGQALFLPAGVPHSYLQGAAVEIMANSDNVLRAGLTSKYVDPDELLRVIRFDAGAPPIIEPAPVSQREAVYPTPIGEFRLSRLRLAPGEDFEATARGPETLLTLPVDRETRCQVRVSAPQTPEDLTLTAGQACLVPDQCPYRATAETPTLLFRARVALPGQVGRFRNERPNELAFGTSGLRGLVSDITDLEAYINARGFIDFLIANGGAVPGSTFAIAGDLRPSTARITAAVLRALEDANMKAIHCGTIPTPALMHYAVSRGFPSIMVTGSHIPFDRNGIKFNKPDGEVLKSDEPAILAAVSRTRALEYARNAADSHFRDDGSSRPDRRVSLPEPLPDARAQYVDRYLQAFAPGALNGLSIVLFEHSAVGREILAEILRKLGAKVHAAGRSDTFVAIDTEAISAQRLQQLQELTDRERQRVGPIDAVVSTDGDSDRPMVLGVDEKSRIHFFGGDVLGTIVSRYLQADAVAVPVSATDLIDAVLEPLGVTIQRTRIGSPWVIAAMNSMPGKRRVGFEANGGFLTATRLSLKSGTLEPLPTRDAVLPIIAALVASKEQQCTLVDLLKALPERYSRSGLLDEVPSEQSQALVARFGAPDSEQKREALRGYFSPEHGFGDIEQLDFTDGIRIHFSRGDIAHVRPSGNAPQLRIYAVANTPERAEQIVDLCLAEPDGILRQLLAASS